MSVVHDEWTSTAVVYATTFAPSTVTAIVIVSLLTPAPSEAVANEFDHYMDEGGAAVEKVVQ